MISLADTSVRMYRKKNGLVSFRLKSYLLVNTKNTFSLDAYLKDMSCSLTLPSGFIVDLEPSYTFTTETDYEFSTMVHGFWANGETNVLVMKDTVGKLRLDYHLSFTGHPSEEPDYYEAIVPLIVRTRKYKGK